MADPNPKSDPNDTSVDHGMGYVMPKTGPDAGMKRYKTHEESIIGGIKGLIGKQDIVEGGKKVSDVVDEAVNNTPGNSADY
jgi:hypothetical protein